MIRVLVFAALIAVIVAPLLLRPAVVDEGDAARGRTVVIITPHNETIRREFARGFARWSRRELGEEIAVEWRSPGGTSEIVRFLYAQFLAGFARYAADHDLAPAALRAALQGPPAQAEDDLRAAAARARALWLGSDVDAAGIDLIFGGGQYDLHNLARAGCLVDAGLIADLSELFATGVIPQRMAGETIYDPEGRYYGACLSSFGICANPDRLRDAGLALPRQWSDLGRPELFGGLALADPTKSGSVTRCFELIIQTCMHQAVAEQGADGPAALDAGWRDGLTLIKRMAGNARSVSDGASEIPRNVARGDAVAGVCIDFYGRTEAEWSAWRSGGRERLVYVSPVGGTSISADPIGLLRGAPHRADAIAFIRYVLSVEGQQLWNYRVGSPGGPQRYALRRWPVRRDLYAPEHRRHFSDPDENPFTIAAAFDYRGAWTGPYFNLIRHTIRAVILDPRPELREAWATIIAAGGPAAVPEAMAAFAWLPFDHRDADAAKAIYAAAPERRLELRREWTRAAQRAYRRAVALARAGR